MTRVVLIVLMLTVAGSSQEKAERWPVQTLSVEGNRHFPDGRILAVAGLKVGQIAGKQEFEAARDRLIATGLFETVGYRFAPAPGGKGYAASFQVVEVEPVYPVRFEDLGVPDSEVAAYLQERDPLFGPQMPGTTAVLQRYASRIQEFLASRKREEKVVGKVATTGPDQFAVLFRPARRVPVVARVIFKGNEAVPLKALQEGISGVAIGVPYKEETFRQLLNTSVRPLYDARGRIRVTFPTVSAVPAKDVEGLDVTVEVSEGASYELNGVRIEGAEGFPPPELLKTAKIKTGDVANFDDVNEGAARVRKLMQRNGYMRAQTTVERAVNDAKKTVDVVIKVEQGPRFTFGKLEVNGLDLHGEAAIRKLWAPQPGRPFNIDYPEYFLNRIREDMVFDNLKRTRAVTQVNEEQRTVDVTLFFNEKERVPIGGAEPAPKAP
ncbi:MAG TPA: POTRA domain-containing protein [Bryobacteraceae bacterium]|nr:POTRA domain-containing protein [Bryobacteraceae bacterium]